ncbi:MAG: hypothetical protein KKD11_07470 [Candidatus Omnitrophica bacterium]|nr:hypothetical protein [Candidatus Omnitrophota bacterium]
MGKKSDRARDERSKQGINQFIIECMFSKYFEENEIVAKQGEIASSLRSSQ